MANVATSTGELASMLVWGSIYGDTRVPLLHIYANTSAKSLLTYSICLMHLLLNAHLSLIAWQSLVGYNYIWVIIEVLVRLNVDNVHL